MTWLRVLQSLHGELAALSMALLLHPTYALWAGRPVTRRGKFTVVGSAGLVSITYGMGLYLYPSYRAVVKRPLLSSHPDVGLLFETKEHLAVAVVSFAIGGALAAWFAPGEDEGIRRLAARMFLGAFAGCVVTAGLGIYVASFRAL